MLILNNQRIDAGSAIRWRMRGSRPRLLVCLLLAAPLVAAGDGGSGQLRDLPADLFESSAATITDCNSNGVDDGLDIAGVTSSDCNTNGLPDECETSSDANDLYEDGTLFTVIRPLAASLGDVDRDGDLDVVVAGECGQILPNDGAGGLGFSEFNPTGQDIALADTNGDGYLDIVVTPFDDSKVSILPNNADGTFAAAQSYEVGDEPLSIAVGDLNGDAHQDIAVSRLNAATVSVLLNQGDGTFGGAVPYPAGAVVLDMQLADLDGDGDLDLAAVLFSQDSVSILLNGGDGTFAAPATFDIGDGPGPRSLVVADLDADERLDLAVVNTLSDSVSVLFGDGVGGIAAIVTYPLETSLFSFRTGGLIAAGDVDGDGDIDLALLGYGLLINLGDGTLLPARYPAWPSVHGFVLLGEMNHDGNLDVVISEWFWGDVLIRSDGDCNANAIPDECEIAAGSTPDCNANDVLDACEINVALNPATGSAANDLNANGFLDECDFLGLSGCLGGPSQPVGIGCGFFDYDASGSIDLRDYAIYEAQLPGS